MILSVRVKDERLRISFSAIAAPHLRILGAAVATQRVH